MTTTSIHQYEGQRARPQGQADDAVTRGSGSPPTGGQMTREQREQRALRWAVWLAIASVVLVLLSAGIFAH